MTTLPDLSLPFFPPFRPPERAERSKGFPGFRCLLTEGAEDRERGARAARREPGPCRKEPSALGGGRRLRLERFAHALCPLSADVGQRLQRWRQEAAAASTSPNTGATFKEGAESLWSLASCCWRTPTARRGLRRRSGDAEKQVKSRPGSGAARAALLPPSPAAPASASSLLEPGSGRVGGFAPPALSLCGPGSEGVGDPGRPRRGPLRRQGPEGCGCPG